jgi:hypothetical protein
MDGHRAGPDRARPQLEVINDSYQDFGAGQFIWRDGSAGPVRQVRGYGGGQRCAPRRCWLPGSEVALSMSVSPA